MGNGKLVLLTEIPASVISLTLIAISSDRSRIIRNPFDSPKVSQVGRIVSIWILSVVIVLPYGIAKRFDARCPQQYKCIKVCLSCLQRKLITSGAIAVVIVKL